ncbi:MAG: hypothetical protein NC200_08510 [Candidatus Gastranaerophilales bacterium]|nr:hypothetical protein [Candidatus Gastranaerophilales bacterium]
MSFINKIVTGALLTGSALGFSGCNANSDHTANERKEVVKELLADRPAKEYNEAVEGWRMGTISSPADAQSAIDSIAYRQIFVGTTAAQDSTKVKEFNSIASKMRIGTYKTNDDYDKAFNELDKKMIDMNISTQEHFANEKEYKSYTRIVNGRYNTYQAPRNSAILAARQFKADSIAYSRFFEKNNLLDSTMVKQIKKVSEKIKIKP